jgi:hypothetical protein
MTSGGDEVAGLELLPRLAGLWSGPATMTPLGTFQLMNMDLRAASGQVLFARADLDALNSLRFAFEVEAPGGAPTLVYRNGGYFLGLLRDSRTALVEQGADSWRFCSTGAQGCDYIDARWTFSGADALVFDVKVKGAQHVYWEATRKETRALPEPFPDRPDAARERRRVPADADAEDRRQLGAPWRGRRGLGDRDDHGLRPAAQVHAQPLAAGKVARRRDRRPPSRSTRSTPAPTSSTSILDRNGNMATTLYPDKGDGVGGLNQAFTVAPTGETVVKAQILITL